MVRILIIKAQFQEIIASQKFERVRVKRAICFACVVYFFLTR